MRKEVTFNMEEDSIVKRICPCCNWQKKATEEEAFETFTEKRFSGDPRQETFCNAVFLPEFVRKFIRLQGERPEYEERKPMEKKTSGIVLTFEIPALADIVYYYSISIDYSTEDISYLLNQHVSNLIKSVMAAGGDVIGLEAGYIQCLWLARLEEMSDLASKILDVALSIQRKYGNTETRFGRSIRNQIGISCGDIKCFFVGCKTIHFVLIGDAVSDSFHAASQCGCNEVVVSREFWKSVIQIEDYKYQTLPDEYVTIYSVDKNSDVSADPEVVASKSSSSEQTLSASSSDLSLESYEQQYGKEFVNYLHPLHQGVNTTQQIQFLCSVSDVVCVAILIRELDLSTPDHLHETIENITEIAQKQRGVVKRILYNQGIIVSVYFGYPGFKRSNDVIRSVQFSQEVFKTLKQAGLQVNIGISSGLIFCGLIGPPTRMEWCLIGVAIKTAHQLSYNNYEENAILCGLATYFLTRRFVGDIFDPVKEKREVSSFMDPELHFEISAEPKKSVPEIKCIGREDEKKELTKALAVLKYKVGELEDKLVPLFLVIGKMGVGKSTLLKWTMEKADDIGFSFSSHVENLSFEESFENAWKIVHEILQKSGNDTEEKILNLVDKNQKDFPLHILNDRLNTEFQLIMALYTEQDIRRLLITLIIKASKAKPILIGIDNLEHVGTETWLFLQELLLTRVAVVIGTVTSEYNPSIPFVKSLIMQQFNSIIMRPLDEEELGLLACVVLNVKAINREFLPCFRKFSEGNALRLEEILMIPSLQKHFAILPYSNVSKKNLESKFLLNKDVPSKFVCDVVDSEAMENLQIPAHLLDVVRDHTTGLNPEEQMLIRKCALLGESFGLFVLEAVCPEYPTAELRHKLRILLKKNLLKLQCHHLGITEKKGRETIIIREIPEEFCTHPIRFYCNYLRTSVLNVMPESQRQRLNLYLADLLMTTPRCDACKNEWQKRKNTSFPIVSRNFHVPCIDMRMCQCLDLKTHLALQVEYHLQKGNGLIEDRIEMLIEAAEFGVLARTPRLIDKILVKTKRLLVEGGLSAKINIDPSAVAIVRLKAQVNLLYGKNNEAMREIKHAHLLLNVLFPSDIEKNVNRHNWTDHPLAPEFIKCLQVGCAILKILGLYEIAYKSGKYHLTLLSKHGHSFVDIVKSKSLLLSIVWKTKPSRKRERQSTKLGNEIRQLCFKRLMEYPIVEIVELKTIISAFKTVLNMLFEKSELTAAEELGKKIFQLLILLKHEKELTRILSVLARIYFFQCKEDKCFEMVSQLENAFQQCVDPVADAIYFSTLVLALGFSRHREKFQDKINICSEYAARTPPVPTHPKFKDRIFCLCASMCMWSCEHHLLDASGIWGNRATNLLQMVRMDNYWTLMGSLCLITSDIERIRRNFVIYTAQELSHIKRNLTKDLERVKKSINNYVPVLNTSIEQIEKNFQIVIERCKILKL